MDFIRTDLLFHHKLPYMYFTGAERRVSDKFAYTCWRIFAFQTIHVKKSQENIKTYWIVLIFINFLSYNCHYSQ